MFKNATIKLTLWYLAIIVAINLSFSVILYEIGVAQINRGLHMQTQRITREFPVLENQRLLMPDRDISMSKHELLLKLFSYNLMILLISGLASYWLARRTLEPIEAAHQRQKRFTSDVSHELRTPLTAIRMESEVSLLNKKADKKELINTIKSNLEEVTKIESLINNLLKLSKLEVEDLRQSFTSVETNTIIDEAIDKVAVHSKKKEIKIIKPKNKTQLIVEKESAVQLLTIILENAIKYSHKRSEIVINLEDNTKQTVISVKDHGIGIKQEDLEHIFDRFYKSDQSRVKKHGDGGYGLGLSIAKMIADVHNANIIIASEFKKGTIVEIVFPKNDL